MATPAPASSESSGPSASSTSSSSSSSNSGEGSGKKSMFDETPEEAKEKKEALRKLASGDAAAAKKVHPTELPKSFIDAVEKDDSKDPVYNSVQAAKEDYYKPATSPLGKEDEAVTIAAMSLLMSNPDQVAKLAKEAPKEAPKESK